MGTVVVLPSGIQFQTAPGQTVMDAAWEQGYAWPTVCNGQGMCKTCVFQVVEGAEHLSQVDRFEQEGLDHVTAALPGDPSSFRLACQARVSGEVTARKIGVRARPVGGH